MADRMYGDSYDKTGQFIFIICTKIGGKGRRDLAEITWEAGQGVGRGKNTITYIEKSSLVTINSDKGSPS